MRALHEQPTSSPAVPEPEAERSGWDPGSVWRDRVQLPRLAQDMARDIAQDLPPELSNEPSTESMDRRPSASEGWDPFQTWQYRVLRLGQPGGGTGD